MSIKKNQHYVPQLYLRFFSVDANGSQIGLFHIPNELYKRTVSLKNQAKEDYFYGKDGFFEEQLSKIESSAAPCLIAIIEKTEVPLKNTPEYLNLLIFTMFMASRTKDAAEDINEMATNTARIFLENHPDFKDVADQYVVRNENAANLAIQITAKILPVTFDLKLKLIVNRSRYSFLTCDNPVIKYNQYLHERKHIGGRLGFATKGLQIFFPISPKLMLCYYDEWAYKIGEKNSLVVETFDNNDVENINCLQVLNSYNSIYFNEDISEYYIRKVYNGVKLEREKRIGQIQKAKMFVDQQGNNREVYHTYQPILMPSLKFSFIKQTKRAKRHTLNSYAVQLRNEDLRNRL